MSKLLIIKITHTVIWIFFNFVMGYLLFAVLTNRIDHWVWLGLAAFVVEGIVLLVYGMMCPLTVMARKYSDSSKDNFDIFLPNWLAKYNKTIYTSFLGIIVIILIFQLANH